MRKMPFLILVILSATAGISSEKPIAQNVVAAEQIRQVASFQSSYGDKHIEIFAVCDRETDNLLYITYIEGKFIYPIAQSVVPGGCK